MQAKKLAEALPQGPRPDPYDPGPSQPAGTVTRDDYADKPRLTGDPENDELELAATAADAAPFPSDFLEGL